jgi:hypothetical protein
VENIHFWANEIVGGLGGAGLRYNEYQIIIIIQANTTAG